MPKIADVVNKHQKNVRNIQMTKNERLFNELVNVYAKLNEKPSFEFEDTPKRKRYYSFAQIAGLYALDTTWFKDIIDDDALIYLSKFRYKLSFCFSNQNTVLLISGITPKEVNETIRFFTKNIDQYSKYQYFTTEEDYEYEDGVIYDISNIDSTKDIQNIILYFT